MNTPDRRSSLRDRFWTWSLLAYWPVLLLLLHWPMPPRPPSRLEFSDKLVHIAIYGLLAILLAGALDAVAHRWQFTERLNVARRLLLIFVVVCLHGLFDEVTQPLTNRNFDWLDLAADAVGAIVALPVYWLVFRTGKAANDAARE